MSRKTSLALAGAFALVLGAGFLVGCTATCGGSLGDGASTGKNNAQGVSDAGDAISSIPVVGSSLGAILKVLGGVGLAYFGTKTVAKNAVKAHDDAPFTPADVVSIKQAEAAMTVPTPPKA